MKSRIGNGDRIAMLLEAGLVAVTLLMIALPIESDVFDVMLAYMRAGDCQ